MGGMLNKLIDGAKIDEVANMVDDRMKIQKQSGQPEQWLETSNTKGRRDKSKSYL